MGVRVMKPYTVKGSLVTLSATRATGTKVWNLHNEYASGQREDFTTTLEFLEKLVKQMRQDEHDSEESYDYR